MGWSHGPASWAQINAILSGQTPPGLDTTRPAPPQPPPQPTRGHSTVAFTELRAHTNYSFLHGAAEPEELVAAAAALGHSAVSVCDRDGLYGVMRLADAATAAGLPTIIGAELTLPDAILPVIVRTLSGYRNLSHVLTQAHMAREDKDCRDYPSFPTMAAIAAGQWYVIITADNHHHTAALVAAFGAARVLVELTATGLPTDPDDHALLTALAQTHGLRRICATGATAATPAQLTLAGAKAALAVREDVTAHRGKSHPAGGTLLRSGEEMAALFAGDPELLTTTEEIASECAWDLDLITPQLPHWDVPAGHTESSWLRHRTLTGAAARYGSPDRNPAAYRQLDYELTMIDDLGFPGYFLIVDDITTFCREQDILAQGRGSAANSCVCFALGITNVDPIGAKLLFERFLSPDRDGPPDIDVDIESGRREEVIQYVYQRYGRDNAAQVANVITYRRRGALRDAARALGYSTGQTDAWIHRRQEVPAPVAALADQLKGHPRHLGIHSGGMVICDRPIADVVPTEWARMPGRSVVQWDKDDCALAGLVKFDLLGLGMLTALHHCVDLVAHHCGRRVALHTLDVQEPAVYEMLCRADAVGVFQVESRAQLNTLPRLKPREFFDLVVEIALIRPGPIQGGSVHPYIRRRNGKETVTYDHPAVEGALSKTLGVPLFQEQLMQIARDVAGFSGAEADQLRRAMGSKRSPARMAKLKTRFYAGAAHLHDMDEHTIGVIWNKIHAFADYGFPESHAQSFASLVFYSAWFKLHYPAAFCAALLRSQPMGFYSPQSLIADARRHGVTIIPADINSSSVTADLTDEGRSVLLGLQDIRGVGEELATRIVTERQRSGVFTSLAELSRRVGLQRAQLQALAKAGACVSLNPDRRELLWQAAAAAKEQPDTLPGLFHATATPALPGMSQFEILAADLATTAVTTEIYPTLLLRERLTARGIIPANQLLAQEDGSRILVAGIVTHRQRPATAGGVVYFGLEDETGLINVSVSTGLWARYRDIASTARAIIARGTIRNGEGAATIMADKLEALDLNLQIRSRDFR